MKGTARHTQTQSNVFVDGVKWLQKQYEMRNNNRQTYFAGSDIQIVCLHTLTQNTYTTIRVMCCVYKSWCQIQ